MSPGERQHLRAVIDQRKRARIAEARQTADPSGQSRFAGPRVPGRCDYCGSALPTAAKPSNAARLRFCSRTHKVNFWRAGRVRLDWEAQLAALGEAVA